MGTTLMVAPGGEFAVGVSQLGSVSRTRSPRPR